MNTPSRSVLVAMTVCPTTTPSSETMRMTSIARSRVAGVLASTSAGLGKSAMPQRWARTPGELMSRTTQLHAAERGLPARLSVEIRTSTPPSALVGG
jgi:hypothetical protein